MIKFTRLSYLWQKPHRKNEKPKEGRAVRVKAFKVIALALALVVIGASVASASEVSNGTWMTIVAPHADDETFEAEYIKHYVDAGYRVRVIFATDSGYYGTWRLAHPSYMKERQDFAREYLMSKGVSEVIFLSLRDSSNLTESKKVAHIYRDLWAIRDKLNTTRIVVVGPSGHSDHIATYKAVMRLAGQTVWHGHFGLPLLSHNRQVVAAWGYDSNGKPITKPPSGTPVRYTWQNTTTLNFKYVLVRSYRGFFYFHNYPERSPSIIKAVWEMHDVYSVTLNQKRKYRAHIPYGE